MFLSLHTAKYASVWLNKELLLLTAWDVNFESRLLSWAVKLFSIVSQLLICHLTPKRHTRTRTQNKHISECFWDTLSYDLNFYFSLFLTSAKEVIICLILFKEKDKYTNGVQIIWIDLIYTFKFCKAFLCHCREGSFWDKYAALAEVLPSDCKFF